MRGTYSPPTSRQTVLRLLPLLLLLLGSKHVRGDNAPLANDEDDDDNGGGDDEQQYHRLSSSTPHLPLRPAADLRRAQVTRSPVLAETSSAIESIWALPITDESLTPGAGGSSKLYGGLSEHTGSSLSTTLWDRHMWDLHKSRARYWRALGFFPKGTIFRALAPLLSVISVWTCVSYWQKWRFTSAALSYLAAPISLMLAFRVNSVVARFHEGRSQWGQVRK